MSEGVEKFGNYFRRKGWLGEEDGRAGRWWGHGEGGVRVVVEYVLFRVDSLKLETKTTLQRATNTCSQVRNGVGYNKSPVASTPYRERLGDALVRSRRRHPLH